MNVKMFMVVLALVSFGAVGCDKLSELGSKEVAKEAKGEWKGDNVYSNEFFDFSIEVPRNWELKKSDLQLSKEEVRELSKNGGDKKMIQASESVGHKVFLTEAMLSSGYSAVNLELGIYNVKRYRSIKDARSYVKELIPSLNKTLGSKFRVVGEPNEVMFGPKRFVVLKSTINIDGFLVQQKRYALYEDGHILLMIASAVNESDYRYLDRILNTVSVAK